MRRSGNPRIVAGQHDVQSTGWSISGVSDPDLRWDGAASGGVYFHGPHAMSSARSVTQMVRHATSADLRGVDDRRSARRWSRATIRPRGTTRTTETPSVAYNPDAPARPPLSTDVQRRERDVPGIRASRATRSARRSRRRQDVHAGTRPSESPHGHGRARAHRARRVSDGRASWRIPRSCSSTGTYHLWLSSFSCAWHELRDGASAYGVGHATSTDGIHWSRLRGTGAIAAAARAPTRTSGGAQPSVIYDAVHCRWELWQTQRRDGRYRRAADRVQQHGRRVARDVEGCRDVVDRLQRASATWSWMASAPGEHLGLLTGAESR